MLDDVCNRRPKYKIWGEWIRNVAAQHDLDPNEVEDRLSHAYESLLDLWDQDPCGDNESCCYFDVWSLKSYKYFYVGVSGRPGELVPECLRPQVCLMYNKPYHGPHDREKRKRLPEKRAPREDALVQELQGDYKPDVAYRCASEVGGG
jgi:hypothetical protein